MKKNLTIVIFGILILFLVFLRVDHKVELIPTYPREAQATKIQLGGYTYQVAWWLWGSHRLEELSIEHDIPQRVLRGVIKKSICKR